MLKRNGLILKVRMMNELTSAETYKLRRRTLEENQEMNGLVSIIVPIYNSDKTLEICVNSLLNQTYKKIEIILVNDGSRDNSLQVCKKIANENSNVLIVDQKNMGAAYARRNGIAHSKGDYLIFIDSDDWIEPEMVSTLMHELLENQVDLVECRFVRNFSNGKKEYSSACEKRCIMNAHDAIKSLNYGEVISAGMCNKIFKKQFFEDSFFKDKVTIGEDYRIIWEYLRKCNKVMYIPNILYHYTQHSGSVCYTGYTGNGNEIIDNYTDIKDKTIKELPELRSSAVTFWMLQEMAVVISMIKANRYDRVIIKRVQKDVRRYLREYLRIKKVPLYLKSSAILLSIHSNCLIIPYKYLFKSKYTP